MSLVYHNIFAIFYNTLSIYIGCTFTSGVPLPHKAAPQSQTSFSHSQSIRFSRGRQWSCRLFQHRKQRSETNGKERGLLKGSKNEINNLFTGPNDTGGSIYSGDREVKVEEFFCIQIHRIKIINKYKLGHGKKVYGLAFYYPKNLSYTYISTTPTIIT